RDSNWSPLSLVGEGLGVRVAIELRQVPSAHPPDTSKTRPLRPKKRRTPQTPPSLVFERNVNLSRAPKAPMERKTRFELATPSLARTCSTAELLPQVRRSIAPVTPCDNAYVRRIRRSE